MASLVLEACGPETASLGSEKELRYFAENRLTCLTLYNYIFFSYFEVMLT